MKRNSKKLRLRFYSNFEIASFALVGIIATAMLLYWFSLGYVTLENLYTKFFVPAIFPFISIFIIIVALRESITVDLENETLSFCIGLFKKRVIPLCSISHISIDAFEISTVVLSVTEKSNIANEGYSPEAQRSLFDHVNNNTIKENRYTIRRNFGRLGFSERKAKYKSFADAVNMIISERY